MTEGTESASAADVGFSCRSTPAVRTSLDQHRRRWIVRRIFLGLAGVGGLLLGASALSDIHGLSSQSSPLAVRRFGTVCCMCLHSVATMTCRACFATSAQGSSRSDHGVRGRSRRMVRRLLYLTTTALRLSFSTSPITWCLPSR